MRKTLQNCLKYFEHCKYSIAQEKVVPVDAPLGVTYMQCSFGYIHIEQYAYERKTIRYASLFVLCFGIKSDSAPDENQDSQQHPLFFCGFGNTPFIIHFNNMDSGKVIKHPFK